MVTIRDMTAVQVSAEGAHLVLTNVRKVVRDDLPPDLREALREAESACLRLSLLAIGRLTKGG